MQQFFLLPISRLPTHLIIQLERRTLDLLSQRTPPTPLAPRASLPQTPEPYLLPLQILFHIGDEESRNFTPVNGKRPSEQDLSDHLFPPASLYRTSARLR